MLTSPSLNPGTGLNCFIWCISIGCALSIVYIISHYLLGVRVYSTTAEEEVSRRQGYSGLLECTPPTASPTGTVSPAPPASSPSSPIETAVAETLATTTPVVDTPPAHLDSPSSPSLTPTPQWTSPRLQQTTPGTDRVGERQSPPNQAVASVLPHSRSPTPETTELTNDLDQPISEQDLPLDLPLDLPPDLLPDASNCLARPSSPAGAFAFTGSAPFVKLALEYFQTVCAGQRWTDMVASFLRLEELPQTSVVSPLFPLFHSRPNGFTSRLFVSPLNPDQPK